VSVAGEPWREVADRVFVRRHASLDLNSTLVVGGDACLVVDTRASETEGADLAAAVRRITPLPWSVVITHAHFDHYLGTARFLPAGVWAQRRCAVAVAGGGAHTRERIARLYDRDGQLDMAGQIRASRIVEPDRLVDTAAELDVGGRAVQLRHFGRGHTDNDLVVRVPDADVVLAGDLVEQGAPPQFADAYPLDWPATLDALLTEATGPASTVVPGHGDVVDVAFVRTQRKVLADLVRRATTGWREGRPAAEVAAELPELGAFAVEAVQRTDWQLDCRREDARKLPSDDQSG
jgi:glyoxylase-like metal-dependent hydrolase (beta-lactamase superfamily II)